MTGYGQDVWSQDIAVSVETGCRLEVRSRESAVTIEPG
jgi:hypothetical protein